MKKLFNLATMYAVLGIIGGVFYREFTKFNSFEGTTRLGFVHTHAFMLGMIFLIIIILLEKTFHFSEHVHFRKFLIFYNIGLLITLAMLVVRGITDVLQPTITNGMNSAISGVSGIGHILLTIALVFFFIILKKQIKTA